MPSFFNTWIRRLGVRREAALRSRLGDRLFRAGDFKGAAAAYAEALELEPDRAIVRMNLGLALYKAGERRTARDHWKAALAASEGKNAYLAEQIAILLRQFG